MKRITRERPESDRIACPWLIKNFIEKVVFIWHLGLHLPGVLRSGPREH